MLRSLGVIRASPSRVSTLGSHSQRIEKHHKNMVADKMWEATEWVMDDPFCSLSGCVSMEMYHLVEK